MIARFIPLEPGVVPDLREAGIDGLDADEPALLGLPTEQATVAGARPVVLDSAPHLTWWAGSRATLLAWCRKTDHRPTRLWPTAWSLPYGGVSFGAHGHIMGVLNITPDSFSDGGAYPTLPDQLARVARILEEGALLVDVGGESTRPGHAPISAEVEWERVLPLLSALSPEQRRCISLDTRHSMTAARAVHMGVSVINDVSGRPDQAMAEMLAASRAGYVYMYNREEPFASGSFRLGIMLREMDAALAHLRTRLPDSLERVAVDPGLGFAYGVPENLTVLRHLALFRLFDRPLVVGGSRKRFVGQVTGRPVADRDAAGTALAALARQKGADLVRTHVVGDAVDAMRMAEAIG